MSVSIGASRHLVNGPAKIAQEYSCYNPKVEMYSVNWVNTESGKKIIKNRRDSQNSTPLLRENSIVRGISPQ